MAPSAYCSDAVQSVAFAGERTRGPQGMTPDPLRAGHHGQGGGSPSQPISERAGRTVRLRSRRVLLALGLLTVVVTTGFVIQEPRPAPAATQSSPIPTTTLCVLYSRQSEFEDEIPLIDPCAYGRYLDLKPGRERIVILQALGQDAMQWVKPGCFASVVGFTDDMAMVEVVNGENRGRSGLVFREMCWEPVEAVRDMKKRMSDLAGNSVE